MENQVITDQNPMRFEEFVHSKSVLRYYTSKDGVTYDLNDKVPVRVLKELIQWQHYMDLRSKEQHNDDISVFNRITLTTIAALLIVIVFLLNN